uniref:endonuclease III domain-containing protein n=1 Tax=Desulfobacca sp. TaxID=2067990 RepID=UPI00404A5723
MHLYQLLWQHYGPQGWWPGETPLEVAVGAILTQNTNWQNVARAIDRLKEAGVLSASALMALPLPELAALIRPAGYYNVKADRLKNFLAYLMTSYQGSMARMAAASLERLRPELLAVKGIGPETADSILLYALHKPIFVVDAYTHRIFARHGLTAGPYSYEGLQSLCHASLPCDLALFQEFHALLVRTGKDYCRPRPRCASCPLADHC